jgi:hypothetical protein
MLQPVAKQIQTTVDETDRVATRAQNNALWNELQSQVKLRM